jgi:hypothetical protein
MALCLALNASAQNQAADLRSTPSANELVADLARLIKERASNVGVGIAYRYSAYADTSMGRKLYVAQQVTMLGETHDTEWYYIDFTQPIKAKQLKVLRGRNGFFEIDASKRITKKLKRRARDSHHLEQGRNARLFISFRRERNKRDVEHEQLHKQVSELISQLINHSASNL